MVPDSAAPDGPQPPPANRPVWRLPGMMSLVILSICGFGGYAALISVAPLWVVRGGAGSAGAGLVTTVMLLMTVLTQAFVPPLLARFGYGTVISVGLLLLGLPSLGYGLSSQLTIVLALSAVRGIGFGVVTVTGSSLVAELAPQAQRGEAIGVYGLAVAIPNLVILPLSVVVADRFGFWWAFGVGAMPILGVPAALAISVVRHRQGLDKLDRPDEGPDRRHERPDRREEGHDRRHEGPAGEPGLTEPSDRGRMLRRLVGPAIVLLAITVTGGALLTFIPQFTTSSTLSALALVTLGIFTTFFRYWIGRVADRRGTGRWLVWLLIVGAVGMALTALAVGSADWQWLLLPAIAIVGTAYGALQNLTLLVSFGQVSRRHYGTASTVWNIGFDSGTALGSALLGVVASQIGFPSGLLILAGVIIIVLPVGWRLSGR